MRIEFSINLADFVGNEDQTVEEVIREIVMDEVRRRVKKHPAYVQYVEKATARAIERLTSGELP